MSGLAALLARRVPPGVYRWEAAYDVEQVRHTVTHAGWRLAHLDAVTVASKQELLAALGGALDFPGHYGVNLDALADCLTDVPPDTVLLWDGWGPFAREDARAFQAVSRILAARATAEGHGAFAALLRGPGPDTDLPLLD